MLDTQFLDQFGEPIVDVGHVAEFVTGGPDEVDQVLVGGQETVLDHGGNGDLKVHRAEEGLVAFAVFPAVAAKVGRSCGEAKDGWSVEQFAGVREDPPPVPGQVVTLVENDQADAGLFE